MLLFRLNTITSETAQSRMLEETPAPLPIIASETVQNEMSEEPSTPLYIAMIKNNSSKILKASMSLNGWQSWLVSQRQTFEFGPKSWKNLFFQNADKSFQLKIETDDGSVLYDSTLDTYFVLEIDKDCTNRKLKAIVEIASKTIVSKEHGRQREQLAVLAARENYYHILQVQNDATMEQIKHSYYRLVLLHHPNKNNNSVESKITMQIIDEAYECLKNPESRKLYDKAVPTGPTAGVSSLISAPIAGASSLISVPIANVFAKPIPGEIADCVAAGGAGIQS